MRAIRIAHQKGASRTVWRSRVQRSCAQGVPQRPAQPPLEDRHHRTLTREGKVFCCAVLDAHSRRVVGWSIDTSQTAALVTNALGMAITNGRPGAGAVVHSEHGSQFTSWVFSQRVSEAGLMPSMGKVGSAIDNAMMESFWARMQT